MLCLQKMGLGAYLVGEGKCEKIVVCQNYEPSARPKKWTGSVLIHATSTYCTHVCCALDKMSALKCTMMIVRWTLEFST